MRQIPTNTEQNLTIRTFIEILWILLSIINIVAILKMFRIKIQAINILILLFWLNLKKKFYLAMVKLAMEGRKATKL